MNQYIEECRVLSLTARAAIALLVFERFCVSRNIKSEYISEFLDYMWEWPLISGPDQFDPWEGRRPLLVNYGLGDDADDRVESIVAESSLNESDFRKLVGGVVEILWVSFWGASENEGSLESLRTVILTAKIDSLPPIIPFRFSTFNDGNGWGIEVTPQDCKFWRRCFK